MDDARRVKIWAERKKISLEAIRVLFTLGYSSMEALACLAQEDLCNSEIKIGQQRLIMKAVKQTFIQGKCVDHDGVTGVTTTQPFTQSFAEGMTQLGHTQEIGLLPSANMAAPMNAAGTIYSTGILSNKESQEGVHSWKDPQIYLKSLVAKHIGIFYDIIDFLNVNTPVKQDVVVSDTGYSQLIYKASPAKPNLETITVAEWSTANLAILYKLVTEGACHITQF